MILDISLAAKIRSPEEIFICNSPHIINSYFSEVFEWLFKCEKIFGFDLEGYGKIRCIHFWQRFCLFGLKNIQIILNGQ